MKNEITLSDSARTIVFPALTSHGWLFHSLTDWYGLAPGKGRREERPQAHGAFRRTRSLRTSKAFGFKTAFRDGSPDEVEAAVSELSSFGAEGEIVVTVEDARGRFQRIANVDIITDQDETRRYTGDMIVRLVADDPRRYSPTEDVPWEETGPPTAGPGRTWPAVRPLVWPAGGSSGRVTVANTGLAPSAPQLQVVGGFGSTLITCVETGARIGLDRVVPVGSVVDIDTELHTATIDGQADVSRWLRWHEWELVPAGESRSYQFDVTAPVGDPKLRGRVLSAWW